MGDADAASIRAARSDWTNEHLETYLTSGGTKGHIMDLSAVGGRELTTHCLIKYVGRKSGKSYVTPLIYGNVGGEIVIVASKGGADTHPEWYLNIRRARRLAYRSRPRRSRPRGGNPKAKNATTYGHSWPTCTRRISRTRGRRAVTSRW